MDDQRNVERPPIRSWYDPLSQHVRVDGEEDDRQWPSWLMIIGIFGTIITFWAATAFTFITYWTLGQALVVLMFAGNLFPGLGSKLRMDRGFWFMFNMLAVGPIVFSTLLWLNFAITTDPRDYVVVQPGRDLSPKRYWLEHDRLPNGFYLLKGTGEEVVANFSRIQKGDRLLKIAKGCLGFDVIRAYDPIEDLTTFPAIQDRLKAR